MVEWLDDLLAQFSLDLRQRLRERLPLSKGDENDYIINDMLWKLHGSNIAKQKVTFVAKVTMLYGGQSDSNDVDTIEAVQLKFTNSDDATPQVVIIAADMARFLKRIRPLTAHGFTKDDLYNVNFLIKGARLSPIKKGGDTTVVLDGSRNSDGSLAAKMVRMTECLTLYQLDEVLVDQGTANRFGVKDVNDQPEQGHAKP